MQKDNDAIHDIGHIYDIGHDRGRKRTRCVKGQQNANNLRRNTDVNVAEIMCKLVNQQSTPEIDTDVFGGNLLEFHYFMAVFDEAVGKKIGKRKAHVSDQIYHWGSKGDGQKLNTASSKGRI